MTRRRLGLTLGTAAVLAAILEAAVGVSAWRGRGVRSPTPIEARAISTPPAGRGWEPPVGDIEDVLDERPGEMRAEPPEVAGGDVRVGATPTGLPLYKGPRGGVYHVSKGGRKVYHKDHGTGR